MANLYVRSGGDAGAWTGTRASVASAASADAAGDFIYVASDHAESNAAWQTWAFAGTNASPTKVICGTTAAAPPTTASTAGTCTTTGANNFIVSGNCYVYGLTINAGSGFVNASINLDNSATAPNIQQVYERCTFKIVATGSNSFVSVGSAENQYPSRVRLLNCDLSFGAAVQKLKLSFGEFVWEGGSILSGSTALTGALFSPSSYGEYATVLVSGVDLQYAGVESYMAAANDGNTLNVVLRDCRVPAWTTGGLVTGTMQARDRVEMHNCDSTDTNYRLWIADYCGSIVSDTSVYNDAGADDGSAQGFSWKMTSSANAEWPHMTLRSPEIVKWNDTTTGTITVAVEVVHNSQGSGTNGAVTDQEMWLEVMYLGTSGYPAGSWTSDRCAILTTAADQASSAASWTGIPRAGTRRS